MKVFCRSRLKNDFLPTTDCGEKRFQLWVETRTLARQRWLLHRRWLCEDRSLLLYTNQEYSYVTFKERAALPWIVKQYISSEEWVRLYQQCHLFSPESYSSGRPNSSRCVCSILTHQRNTDLKQGKNRVRKKQEATHSSVSGESSQSSGAGEALSEVLQGNNETIILINQHKSDNRMSLAGDVCVFLDGSRWGPLLQFKHVWRMYDCSRSLYVESRQEQDVAGTARALHGQNPRKWSNALTFIAYLK